MSAGTGASAASLLPVAERRGVGGHIGLQRLAGRAEVAGARRHGGVTARRGPRPEVLLARELLRQQLGADDLAVALDQAAVGLVVKRNLRDAGDDQRVHHARQHGEDDREQDGLNEKFHDGFPFFSHYGARCTATSNTSINLMKMNGMMMPPTP